MRHFAILAIVSAHDSMLKEFFFFSFRVTVNTANFILSKRIMAFHLNWVSVATANIFAGEQWRDTNHIQFVENRIIPWQRLKIFSFNAYNQKKNPATFADAKEVFFEM